jgi:hypothetical protein
MKLGLLPEGRDMYWGEIRVSQGSKPEFSCEKKRPSLGYGIVNTRWHYSKYVTI